MKYLAALFILLICYVSQSSGQSVTDSLLKVKTDSLRTVDSLKRAKLVKDSLAAETGRRADSALKVMKAARKQRVDGFQAVLQQHPFLNFYGRPVRLTEYLRNDHDNDSLFYFIIGLVLYIALLRLFFYKYITTMFTLFFRATLRQQQLREQLLQAPFPALLMNIFFVVSVATFCTLVAGHLRLPFYVDFWQTLVYAIVVIAGIYIVKYIFLNMVGWIFGIGNVTDTYIFIVFLINKMIGIFLLPFIALLAFPSPAILPAVLIVSYILVAGMLFYRFLISYRPVRSEIKLNRFHFFLYLCAFEIAPLLLIYKVLLAFVIRSL